MSKLLETRLPIESNQFVNRDIYNRLVRILELNLGTFDPDSTPQFNDEELGSLKFNQGDVVWNTSIGVLQVYTGNKWIQLHTPKNPKGFELQAELGSVTVRNKGAISIEI
jgi:hypothetical protein